MRETVTITKPHGRPRQPTEPRWIRWLLTGTALLFLGLFLVVPLVSVFWFALSKGWSTYLASFDDPYAWHAIQLTVIVVISSVVCNGVFGITAAWAITKFQFRGKSLLLSLIDLPFAVSPVIAGLIFVLIFGLQGLMGHWLEDHHIRIIFAVPGIVLATMFITFPFVARELIPVMQSQGTEEEEAARMLGAGGLRIFWRITLPNIKWGLLYGLILCSARAMGEFGAVSVVSGHISGQTNTLPLHIEVLYNGSTEHERIAAFACASLLTLLALVTLIIKSAVEWHTRRTVLLAESEAFEGPPASASPSNRGHA
ncbi:MAG: sulfate ABC transporter permease subunit CysW [Planctomycetes bacterium]|nr:sulfate ABC transporter permease subunit CysW [Planctomycetota bacterium]